MIDSSPQATTSERGAAAPAVPGGALQTAIDLLHKGAAQRAAQICHDLLSRPGDHPEAMHLLGLIALEHHDYDTARTWFTKALQLTPYCAGLHNDMGLVLKEMGRCAEALAAFDRALGCDPGLAAAYYNQGLCYRTLQREAEAVDAFRLALERKADYAKAHFSLGDLYLCRRNFNAAACHLQAAIDISPGYVAAYNHLALCLIEQERLEDAHACLRSALALDPHCAETLCNLGNLARQSCRFEEAIRYYRHAIEQRPGFIEAHFNLSLVMLLLEDFDSGWREYEWRLRFFHPDSGYPNRHGLPLWQGEPLKGKSILVYDEQGFGDVFMFCRYLSLLKSEGARIVLETRKSLIDLLVSMPQVDEIVRRDEALGQNHPCDYCIPLLSLPGRFHTRRATIPNAAPYLFAGRQRSTDWSRRMSAAGLKIGLVWHGSAADRSRRCRLSLFRPLTAVADTAWYGLQKEWPQGTDDVDADERWLTQLGPELNDFADTAAAIDNLDLVISIDTAVAHLAGAMGKPVWVLLPWVPDWRWGLQGTTTPWYPTMRLYRQPSPGDWNQPIAAIASDLQRWIEDHRLRLPRHTLQCKLAAAQTFHREKAYAQAEASYRQLLEMAPNYHPALSCLGLLFLESGRFAEAVASLGLALKQRPNDHLVLNNLGMAYQQQDQRLSAFTAFFASIACRPDYACAYRNVGNLFWASGDTAVTIDWYARALSTCPDDVQAQCDIGKLYLKRLDLDAARAHFQNAVKLSPDDVQARICLATTALRQGDFATGWEHYRYRFSDPEVRDLTYPHLIDLPRWRGESFVGRRLLVHCEQGFGDTFQFARFLPWVKALGGEVIFQVQAPLLPLFKGFPGVDRLETIPVTMPERPDADLYVPLLDVPGYLGISPETIPTAVPYLAPESIRVAEWRQRIGSEGFKIGLVWTSNPNNLNARNRSCPPRELSKIGRITGVRLFSLQPQAKVADRSTSSDSADIVDLGSGFKDFGDTAAAIASLDLVITVDTAVAHLSGAMGRPTWILLTHLPCWRWMLHRSDSPWYPHTRLFRQPSEGDWTSVVEAVAHTLKVRLEGFGSQGTHR